MPAAVRFRDPANTSHRRLSLFWTSNRPDAYPAASGSGYRTPQPPTGGTAAEHPQSWYVYGTRSWEIQDADEFPDPLIPCGDCRDLLIWFENTTDSG